MDKILNRFHPPVPFTTYLTKIEYPKALLVKCIIILVEDIPLFLKYINKTIHVLRLTQLYDIKWFTIIGC